jgi:uncharacterized membrane protein YjjP (DUF1212 family)
MDSADYRKRTRFVIQLGRALHSCGASSHRIEKHLGNVSRMVGLQGHFLFTPTGFTCAFWQEDEVDQQIHIERVEPGEMNLGRLWMIDSLIESIHTGKTSLEEGMDQLPRLAASPPLYSRWMQGLSWIITGGAFAALLSNHLHDVWISLALSTVTFLLHYLSQCRERMAALLKILAPFLSGVVAQIIASRGIEVNVPFVILSSILVFIPGLSLTVAMSEISARQLVSGSSRLVDAIMNLLLLLFGAVMGISLASLLWPSTAPILASGLLPAYKNIPAVLLLAFSLNIAFDIPMRKCIWGIIACVIAFFTAKFCGATFGLIVGMFFGALAVGLYSNLFARIARAPSSVLSTQGIILLVPGSTTYMLLNEWVSGTQIIAGTQSSSQALMMFVSLVAGLLFANALLPPGKSL